MNDPLPPTPSREGRGSSPGPTAIFLTLATLLGLALRLRGLWDAELTYDEGATWYFAGLSLPALWGPGARLETNPPLFYALAHVVRAIGATAEDERLLSVAAGTACIPLTFLLAARIGGRFAGVGAALLVAVSAASIGMGQDARAYAMLSVAGLAALLAVRRVLDGGGMLAWAWYVVAALAALYLHNTAVLLVAACNGAFFAAWLPRRPAELLWRWGLANAVVLVGWLPWAGLVLEQARHALAHFWLARPTLSDFRYEVFNTFAVRFLDMAQPFADLAVLGLLAFGVFATRRAPFARALAVCVLVGVPLASFAVSQWRPILNGKTLLWLVPVGLTFVAVGCAALPRWRLAALGGVLALHLLATGQFFHARAPEGTIATVEFLTRAAGAEDALVLAPRFLAFMLAYQGLPPGSLPAYAMGDAAPWFPDAAAPSLSPEDALARLRTFPRVWLAVRGQPEVARALSERLDCAFVRTDIALPPGAVRLLRFERRAAPSCG